MFALYRSLRRKDSGFTLIELLVVIIIIGILASIATIGINGARRSAYVGQCTANTTQVLKAILAYKSATDTFPGETTTSTTWFLSNSNIQSMVTPGYLVSLTASNYDVTANSAPYWILAKVDLNSATASTVSVRGVTAANNTAIATSTDYCKAAVS